MKKTSTEDFEIWLSVISKTECMELKKATTHLFGLNMCVGLAYLSRSVLV